MSIFILREMGTIIVKLVFRCFHTYRGSMIACPYRGSMIYRICIQFIYSGSDSEAQVPVDMHEVYKN